MTRAVVAALATLCILATPAQAAVCGYDPGTRTAAVAITPGTASTLEVNGTAIQVDGANCGAATTTNTDTIDVNGSGDVEQLVIDLGGGPFAPGFTNEPGSSDEIEFVVELGVNFAQPDVWVEGTPGVDHLTVGTVGTAPDETSAINLNANEVDGVDADVTFDDAKAIQLDGLGGGDFLSAAGGDGIPGLDHLATLVGGPGDDDLTSSFVWPGAGNDTIRDIGVEAATWVQNNDAPNPTTITLGDGPVNWGGTAPNGDGQVPPGTDTYVGRMFVIDGSNTAGDVFTGSSLGTGFDGNGGADTINGGTGNEWLRGGPGVDTIHGGGGDDTVEGGADDDFVFGDADDDIVKGSGGDDEESGGAGDDRFVQSGPNMLAAEAANPNGADDLIGGPGRDAVEYGDPGFFTGTLGRTASVSVDLAGDRDDGATGENDQVFDDVEDIVGGRGNDTLVGDGDANVISGAGGGDTLRGGGGADELHGYAAPAVQPSEDALATDGGDDLDGEGGSDTLSGERGDDTIEARDGAADTIACGGGTDSGRGDRIDTVGGDCEAIALPVEMPPDPPVTPPVDPPVTPPTVPPVVVPPVVTPPAPKVGTLLTLPSSRRCASRRKFTVRVRREIRGTVRRVTIFVNGRRVKTVSGTRIGLPIDLRGLPKGRVRVRLRVELKDGRVATDTRTYRTCATKKRKGQFGRRRG